MPLYMDFHRLDSVTVEDVKKAHMADKAIQDQYGVKYIQFWVNEEAGTVFCLTEGPDSKTCELVHKMAHGNIACAITEVEPGYLKLFMGDQQADHGFVPNDTGYRNIIVVSLVSDTQARAATELVQQSIGVYRGRLVNWDLEGNIAGVFNDVSDAIQCSQQIQREFSNHKINVTFRMGLSADQPVTEKGEFFSKALMLANRLCQASPPNHILASSLVKQLSQTGKTGALSDVQFLNMTDETFVYALFEIMDKNLSHKEFSVDVICREMGISRPQLYRKITAITKCAPNDLLRNYRLDRAYVKLKIKSGNVAQIALEVGYNNPSYFSKCFAEKFGFMPSEVLKAHTL